MNDAEKKEAKEEKIFVIDGHQYSEKDFNTLRMLVDAAKTVLEEAPDLTIANISAKAIRLSTQIEIPEGISEHDKQYHMDVEMALQACSALCLVVVQQRRTIISLHEALADLSKAGQVIKH